MDFLYTNISKLILLQIINKGSRWDKFIRRTNTKLFTKNNFGQEVDAIFTLGDINDDGIIDLEEFIGVMYPSASTVVNRLKTRFSTINDVKAAFAAIDKNADGKISCEEMAESEHFNGQEIEALFTLGDANNDGEIDLEEFIGVLYPVVAQALKKFTKGKMSSLTFNFFSQN